DGDLVGLVVKRAFRLAPELLGRNHLLLGGAPEGDEREGERAEIAAAHAARTVLEASFAVNAREESGTRVRRVPLARPPCAVAGTVSAVDPAKGPDRASARRVARDVLSAASRTLREALRHATRHSDRYRRDALAPRHRALRPARRRGLRLRQAA